MKIKQVLLGLLLMAPAAIALAGEGDAAGLAGIATGLTNSLKSVATLMMGVSFVAGVGFVISGLIKFKAHKENPQQVPLGQPIMLLIVGAALTFLPTVINVAGTTLFGGSQTTSGSSGAGLTALDSSSS